jgi:hypothetical protein
MSKEKSRSKQENYLATAFVALIVVLIFEWAWPEYIPFGLFEFWHLNGSLIDVFKTSWPLFAWGFGLNVIILLTHRNSHELNKEAESILIIGCIISVFAGLFEEIAFRWLIFYDQIIVYKALNSLLFAGWGGIGVFEWFFTNISGPIANTLTLGYLHPYLFNGLGWAVGSAILSSNGKFRDGHMYQGRLGTINAWFAGMFFFYLMFRFGLIASILVHFAYDMMIFTLAYIDAAIERAIGW